MHQTALKTGKILESSGEDNYITPYWIYKDLGEFDLDPACPVRGNPKIAKEWRTRMNWEGCGLSFNWFGRVWLNPPYGRGIGRWTRKMAEHGSGIMLVFARTDTQWFQDYVFDKAQGILFLKGRVKFLNLDGAELKYNSPAASCLVAYGQDNLKVLADSGLEGKLVRL